FYAVPLFSSQNLRTAPTIKIFVIAAVWAGATVYLPKIILDLDWGMEIAMILMQRFLFVLALILPFEIRDLAHDDKKLATLPQLLGIQKSIMVGYSILIMAGVLNLAYNGVNDLPVVAVFIILTGLAIYYSKKLQNKYYASFWVEGIPIYCWVVSLFI
ncbi:MAG: hypothetical protein WA951_12800, partial [Leeuwenhoekiella sp.]